MGLAAPKREGEGWRSVPLTPARVVTPSANLTVLCLWVENAGWKRSASKSPRRAVPSALVWRSRISGIRARIGGGVFHGVGVSFRPGCARAIAMEAERVRERPGLDLAGTARAKTVVLRRVRAFLRCGQISGGCGHAPATNHPGAKQAGRTPWRQSRSLIT